MKNAALMVLFIVSCVYAQHVVFDRLCAEGRRLRDVVAYVGMLAGMTVVAAVVTWGLSRWVVAPLNAAFLELPLLALAIALLSLLAERLAKKTWPGEGGAAGGAPWIAATCAVFGAAALSVQSAAGFGKALLGGVLAGVSFLLAVACMCGMQERLENAGLPASLKGLPITLITASLMALAFIGLAGIL